MPVTVNVLNAKLAIGSLAVPAVGKRRYLVWGAVWHGMPLEGGYAATVLPGQR